jgi:hypothetical protein
MFSDPYGEEPSVWPMSALPQSGHVSLYTPEEVCMSSWVCLWFVTWLSMESLVRNATFILVCLNRFVMYVVSLPVQVKVAQFWSCVCGGVRRVDELRTAKNSVIQE